MALIQIVRNLIITHPLLFRAAICDEIICCRGDQVKLAVRVRIYPYPENTCATWVMFAVKYKSIL